MLSGAGRSRRVGLLSLESFSDVLQAQVVVPRFGESRVLLVQADEVDVLVADNRAAPLLHAYIVVPVMHRFQFAFLTEVEQIILNFPGRCVDRKGATHARRLGQAPRTLLR